MFTASDQIMWECPPMERKWKSNVEIAPKCPRCASSNTKFCYYNNYSLSQPRYFCKGCRRYWTKGGSLRNVPVGGGCRKPRRAKSTRVSHIDRYSKNLTGFDTTRTNDQPIPDGYSANLDATSRPSATNGPDIDLAVVFAKYLNQDSSSFQPQCHGQNLPDESNEFVNLSNSLTPDSLQSDATIEFQKPADLIFQEYSPDLLGGLPQMIVADQELIQSSNSSGVNEIGLQTLLGDEIVQDVLWSDAEPAAPSVSWPLPTVQVQEFDPFPPVEDQPKNAANFLSDNNWGSSFDLSAFEVFSRP